MLNFPGLSALNAWLEQRCKELWRETAHRTLPGMIADVWAEEQVALVPLPPTFDTFIELSKRVLPTCLICFERNRYSVPASFANRPVSRGSVPTNWLWRPWATSCVNISTSLNAAINCHRG